MVTASATIGAVSSGQFEDGDYATFALWVGASSNSISNGDDIEITLLDGSSHNLEADYFNWATVGSFNLTIKGQSTHGGDWNASTAKVVGGLGGFRFYSSSVTLTYKDIIAEFNIAYPLRFESNSPIHPLPASSQYHLVIDTCLMTASPRGAVGTTFLLATDAYELDPSGNVSALGDVMVTCKNSVFESNRNGNNLFYFNDRTTWHQNSIFRAQGCTFRDCNLGGRPSTQSTISEITVEGCMFDTINPNSARFFGGFQNVPTSSISGVSFTDYISAGNDFNYLNSVSATLTNCASAVTFNYDGTVTAGNVNFVDNAGASAFRDYRLVADPDNLPVRYMDLSSIWETCSKDITGRKRPGSTDAGAFQSVSNRVISGDIPSQYGTAQLFYTTQDASSFLNGDTYLGVIESGSSIYSTYIQSNTGGREVDFDIHLKGASSHEGNWDQGTIILPPNSTGHLAGVSLNSGRQDNKIIFEDLVFSGNQTNHTNNAVHNLYKFAGNGYPRGGGDWWASQGVIGTDPNLLEKSRNAYDYEYQFNNCLIQTGNVQILVRPQFKSGGEEADGTFTKGVMKTSFSNSLFLGTVTSGSTFAMTPLYGVNGQLDLDIKGSTFRNIKTHNNYQEFGSIRTVGSLIETGPGGASGISNGYVENFMPKGWHYNYRNLTFSSIDSIFSQVSADLVGFEYGQATGSGILENSIASGFVVNTQFGVPFTFDGTVSSNQVGFQVGGNALSTPRSYNLVADPDNLPVRYMDLSSMYVTCSKDITGFRRPGSTDAGAYQSISDRVISGTIGTGGTHASLSIFWNSQSSDQFLNGDTYRAIFKEDEYVRHALEPNYNFPTKEVNLNIEIVGETPHNGNWGVGAQFLEGIVSIIGGEACRQDVNFLLKDVICRQTEGIDFHNNHFHQFNQRCGDYTGLFSRNPLIDQFTENVYHSKIMHENCLISLGSSGSPIFDASGRNFATLGHDCVIDDRPGEHPRPYNDVNTNTLNYTPNIVERGSLTLGFNNCLILGDKFGQGISRIDNFSRFGGSNYYLEMIGCTVRDVQSIGTEGHNTRTNYNLKGSLIETSGVGGQTDSFIYYGWNGVDSINQTVFKAEDCIFSQPSSTLVGAGGFLIPAGSGLLENSIASGFVVNTQFGVPFTYDGTVTSGQVGFEAGGGDLSTLRTYNLVADLDNLPVQYFSSNRGPLSDGYPAVTYRDITNNLRPGDSDAGAYQSIDTSVSSFEIGASSLGHARDGDYATVVLWHNDNKYKFLNGTTHELTLLEGEHDMPFTYLYQDNRVNHKVKVKGETSHQGYWTSGTSFNLGGVGYVNNADGAINQSISWSFEDLLINHDAWILRAMTPYSETVAKDYVYGLELNNCLVSSTVPNNIVLMEFSNLRKTEVTLTNNVFNLVAGFIGDTIKGSVTVKGNTFRSPGHFQNFIGTTGDSSGVIEGNLYEGPTNRNFVAGFDSGLTLRDNIINVPSIPTFSNVTGTLALANNTVGASFNYDGTVTSGEVCFVGSANSSDLDYRLVADLDNLPVKYMTQDSHTYKDITGYKRPGGIDQRDAGAYQSISDKVTVKNIGTSSVDFTPDYATISLWRSNYFNNANILNGETNVIRLKSGESHDITSRVILDGDADVNQNFVISGQTPHYGDWASGASLSLGYGSVFQVDHFKNSFKVKLEDLTYSSVTGMPLYGIVGAINYTYGYRHAVDTPWRTISSKHEYELENCMFKMDTSQGGNDGSPIVFSKHYARITDSDGNLIERGEVHHTHRNCVFLGTSAGLGIFENQYGSADTKQVAQVIGCTIVNSTIATGGYMSPGRFEGSAIGSLIYLDPSLISFRNAPKGLFDFVETYTFRNESPSTIPIYAVDCISNRATSSTFTEPHIGSPQYIAYSDTDLYTTNITYNVPFNFDGSVSAGTVSFVDGSSGVNNYRLAWSPDNLAVQYAANATVSGTDIAGRVRGSDYSVAATPIPPVLDNYSGAAAAYSVRLLNSSYTGSCMEVQRGDGQYQSIGFDSNGDLDTAAIKTFCDDDTSETPTVGTVRTWYDQSGSGNHATQSDTTKQPQIYNGTTVLTKNGKPAAVFDGSSDYMDMPDNMLPANINNCSVFTVQTNESSPNGATFNMGGYGPNDRWFQTIVVSNTEYFGYGSSFQAITIGAATTSQRLITAIAGSTQGNAQCFVDGTSQGSATLASISPAAGTGEIVRSGYLASGTFQEIIVYHSDQSTNRTTIESNINAYYGIYNDPNWPDTTVTWGDYPDAGAYELYPDLFLKAGFGNVYINLYS